MEASGTQRVSGTEAGTVEAGRADTLKRGISPRMLLFFVLGDILGAGIYIRVGSVAGEVGGAIWTSFLVALGLAALTAASYVELVGKYPGAGGAPLYVHKAFKRPFLTFMLAFAVLASGISSACVAARSFGSRYMASLLDVDISDVVTILIAVAFIAMIAVINYWGVTQSVKTNIVLTIVELSGLIIVIVIGLAALLAGDGDLGRPFEFKQNSNIALAIIGGTVVAFYALIGFEDAVNMAEETQNPGRTFPRALFGGLFLAGLIYLVIGFIASAVVPTATLAGNKTGPLLEVVRIGPLAMPTRVFSAIALIAITNTALLNMIMASRVTYGMGRQGIVPSVFARTHSTRRTPYIAILFTTLIAFALVWTSTVSQLADTTVMLLLIAFTLVNISVLVLRRDHVDRPHFRTPTILPVLGAAACLFLLTQQDDLKVWTIAGALLAVGLVLWVLDRVFSPGGREEFDVSQLEA